MNPKDYFILPFGKVSKQKEILLLASVLSVFPSSEKMSIGKSTSAKSCNCYRYAGSYYNSHKMCYEFHESEEWFEIDEENQE